MDLVGINKGIAKGFENAKIFFREKQIERQKDFRKCKNIF